MLHPPRQQIENKTIIVESAIVSLTRFNTSLTREVQHTTARSTPLHAALYCTQHTTAGSTPLHTHRTPLFAAHHCFPSSAKLVFVGSREGCSIYSAAPLCLQCCFGLPALARPGMVVSGYVAREQPALAVPGCFPHTRSTHLAHPPGHLRGGVVRTLPYSSPAPGRSAAHSPHTQTLHNTSATIPSFISCAG